MRVRSRHPLILAATLLAAPMVQAHPLAAHGDALHAFLHPFSGLDHVAAMLVIGLWAGLAAPSRRLLPPLGFVAGLMVGVALGAFGIALPAVETALALSVLLLGPLAARDAGVPALLCLVLCAAAGLVHGYAHGVELGGHGLAGLTFVAGSVLMHTLGFGLARRMTASGHAQALRTALSASALLGLGLVWMA